MKLFLDNDVDIDAQGRGYTALHIAVLTAQDLLVTALLSHGAEAQGVSLVCLNWGLSTENLDQLLQRGADPEAIDSRHRKTALIWASETGSADTVRVLLNHGANVNAQDNQSFSALRYATANACTETVQLLLEKGADPCLSDSWGKTPIIAVAWGRPFHLDGRYYNPSPTDREKTASLLLDAGTDASSRDISGATAVYYAAKNGYLGVLKLLHKQGHCDLSLKWKGRSLLEVAEDKEQGPTVKWLKKQLVLDQAASEMV